MAFLKFNKSELVNLAYSLKREIICAGRTGAYCNTSIVTCNTRRYHGLFAVTLDRFGGDRFLLLSSVDETLVVDGKQFNLGIHCYGDIYEPRGHKYVVDYEADPVPCITYKVGQVVFRKSLLLCRDKDRLFIKYELLEAPAKVKLQLKPLIAFRNIHDLTHRNDAANTSFDEAEGGVSYREYAGFPNLFLQLSRKSEYHHAPCWNMNITYSDEYRRGFDCREDLLMPGWFELELGTKGSVILSVGKVEERPASFTREYNAALATMPRIEGHHDQLEACASTLVTNHNGRRKIEAGYSWLYSGLLRETLEALPGLTLYGLHSPAQFEEILDNLIADEQERLTRRTTQVEAPLYMASTLQAYIDYGASEAAVWKKYGHVIKNILDSYLPGERREVAMQPNGLLWAQMDGVALSWMNAYIGGRAVTERAGYQVETNALWYNTICFALEMERKYGSKAGGFEKKWSAIAELVRENFTPTFFDERAGYLADYVDANGRNMEVRPNQLYALWVKYSPVEEELHPLILRVIDGELVTARGIRTLSPRDIKYKGVYEGSQIERDLAYHNGCAHTFLLEQYIDVAFRVKGQSFWKKAEWLTEGFFEDLGKHGVGAFSELYDGDPPHEAHGAISSALSTAALLVADHLLDKYKEDRI
ncbi:MAG: glycogen debranching enzyme N-terminal domain-containing protein [Bacteroidales bacterium]|nr:glycogen debranching enzyme N-terminal domain-containing protein [Candidatus Cryptobacteroides aphodequi]